MSLFKKSERNLLEEGMSSDLKTVTTAGRVGLFVVGRRVLLAFDGVAAAVVGLGVVVMSSVTSKFKVNF